MAQGWADTRAALREWNGRPMTVLAPWTLASFAVVGLLLAATWVVATQTKPDPSGLLLPGINEPATLGNYFAILYRNSLVLALHAMACVAGFMAGSSLPQVAEGYSGIWRRVHDLAGPLAIGFVIGATLFSLGTQAYVIGGVASTAAAQLHTSPAILLLGLMPHAIPELFALFLPLAAWTVASRKGRWDELLAATFVTVGLSVPILLAAAAIEVWVSPHVMLALT